MADPLEHFAPATRDWFGSAFPSPRAVQTKAWATIGAGDNALVIEWVPVCGSDRQLLGRRDQDGRGLFRVGMSSSSP